MFKQKELLLIKDPTTIKFLSRNSFRAFYLLKPFFNEPRSLKEASIETYTASSSYYYWIKKFLDYDLLKTVRQEGCGRATGTYYLATAKKILIKADNNLSLDKFYNAAENEYQGQTINRMAESCLRVKDEVGFLFSKGTYGDLSGQIVSLNKGDNFSLLKDELLKDSSPAAFASWQEVPLKHADAKEFQRRLANLLAEYQNKANPNENHYLLQLAIVPKD